MVTMETAGFHVSAHFQIREQLPLHTSGFDLMDRSRTENDKVWACWLFNKAVQK